MYNMYVCICYTSYNKHDEMILKQLISIYIVGNDAQFVRMLLTNLKIYNLYVCINYINPTHMINKIIYKIKLYAQ